jgi:hypothetical protein
MPRCPLELPPASDIWGLTQRVRPLVCCVRNPIRDFITSTSGVSDPGKSDPGAAAGALTPSPSLPPIDPAVLSVLILVACLPSASNVAMLSERFGADTGSRASSWPRPRCIHSSAV